MENLVDVTGGWHGIWQMPFVWCDGISLLSGVRVGWPCTLKITFATYSNPGTAREKAIRLAMTHQKSAGKGFSVTILYIPYWTILFNMAVGHVNQGGGQFGLICCRHAQGMYRVVNCRFMRVYWSFFDQCPFGCIIQRGFLTDVQSQDSESDALWIQRIVNVTHYTERTTDREYALTARSRCNITARVTMIKTTNITQPPELTFLSADRISVGWSVHLP